jgi:predicted PurR-regulated permease PerM
MTVERQLRFWLVGLVVFLLALYFLRAILLPFVAGMAVAYFLDPVCDRIERWGASRVWATSIVTALFGLVVALGLFLIVPPLERQIVELAAELPNYLQTAARWLQPLIDQLRRHLHTTNSALLGDVGGQLSNVAGWLAQTAGRFVSGGLAFFNLLSLIFITPIVTFYFLRDWDRLVARIDSWLPRDHAVVIRQQLSEIDRTLAGFARGQATVCLCLAAYYGIGFSLVGLDFGLALGLVAGLLSFIPFVGSAVALVGSIGLALVQYADWLPVALTLGVCVLGQVLEGNFLTPKLVGDRVGLHPVWVIFALLAGGALFGFLGLLLAVPVAAVLGVLARFSLVRYLTSNYFRGATPPGPPAEPPTA